MKLYNIYPTILDSFQGYLDSSENYQHFWGNSENPSKTEDEYEKECFDELINRINRVPFQSEAADKGTAFNEIVDCLIANRKSDKMKIEKVYQKIIYGDVYNCDADERWADVEYTNKVIALQANYKNQFFTFPLNICKEFAKYFSNAISQVFCEGIIQTKYGNVNLYGYIDEILPFSIHDIKTTRQYHAFKYRKNWQHKVYPYCIMQSGSNIFDFEYNVTDFNKTYTEHYLFNPNKDIPILIEICERFINFLEAHRNLITDKKIFNEHE